MVPRELGMPRSHRGRDVPAQTLGFERDNLDLVRRPEGYAGTIQAALVMLDRQRIRQLRRGWGFGSLRGALPPRKIEAVLRSRALARFAVEGMRV